MPKKSNLVILLLLALFLAMVAVAANAFFSRYRELTSANLDAFIRSFGAWSLVVFIFTYIIASPIPFMATILAGAGGLLFGPWIGLLIATLVGILTSLIPFSIARRLGRDWVQAKMKGGKLERFINQWDDGSGFKFVFILRIVPVLPWEMQNYVAGVTKIKLPAYFLATFLGMIPMSLGLVLVGAAAKQPGSWQFYAALVYAAAAFLVPMAVLYFQQKRKSSPRSNEDTKEHEGF